MPLTKQDPYQALGFVTEMLQAMRKSLHEDALEQQITFRTPDALHRISVDAALTKAQQDVAVLAEALNAGY